MLSIEAEQNNETTRRKRTADYKVIHRDNEKFFEFYRRQGIISDEEWNIFVETLRLPLPSSFRIQLSLPERDLLAAHLKEVYFTKLRGDFVPRPIPFVPYAFHMDAEKKDLRKHPALAEIHEFLVNETTIGNISRQEVVSMVPPLFLDIQPHHNVFDACAAPGSKTAQIVELMHAASSDPEGILIANDIDFKRCYLLVHQTLGRMPTANCVVTNHDAAQFPQPFDGDGRKLMFDRILCDAICSGDGTFRKNPELWTSWDPVKCLHLHKLQRRIANRCVELLADGGLMVYSTCSLNPIEDEAIVADLLRRHKDNLELVDVSEKLPELKRAYGHSSWKVLSESLEEFETFSAVPESERRKIVPSMFPPTQQEAEAMHLERSFRILPHAQNSGGFFVAVLKKITSASGQNAQGDDRPPSSSLNGGRRGQRENRKRKAPREESLKFLGDNEQLKKELEEHFGLEWASPIYANLMTRCSSKEKNNISYVNERLRGILQANEGTLRVINAGVSVLKKTDKFSSCEYRLKQDGLRVFTANLKKRVVDMEPDDLVTILLGSGVNQQVPIASLRNSSAFAGLRAGSIVLRCCLPGTSISKTLCGWLGTHTINPFVCREEKVHLMAMLGANYSQLLRGRKEESVRDNQSQNDAIGANKQDDAI